jgi:NAD(P)H-hydrate epimerase
MGLGMSDDSMTSRDMRALEVNSEYFGVSRLLLMENAGHSVALEVASRFEEGNTVLVFCGLGGNGGDGFVAARHLSSMGFNLKVVLAGRGKDILDKAALENWRSIQSLNRAIDILEVHDSSLIPETRADVVVDALLGTGTKGSLRPPILQLVKRINAMTAFRVAVDVPTGIDADTGEVMGEAVKADLTLTFHKTKKGLEEAKKYTGKLIVKGIGIPPEFERLAGPGDVMLITKPRPSESHKGDFGRVLVIGGSETFSGAPTLVAQAALRTGVDLAYVAAPERTAYTISSFSPDLIAIKLRGKQLNPENMTDLNPFIQLCDAVVVGPGLGLHSETKMAVKAVVEAVEKAKKALLLDADGLKAFAEFKRRLSVPCVLTPHAGEYNILTGRKPPEDLSAEVAEVLKTAKALGAVILLKGPVDLISDGKRSKLNFTGNPGMTVGGTGDVLSGVVGAFLAQRADGFEAAVAGAFVNGAAGDFVFEEKGPHMVATDLIDWIPRVLNDPMSHLKVRKARAETG